MKRPLLVLSLVLTAAILLLLTAVDRENPRRAPGPQKLARACNPADYAMPCALPPARTLRPSATRVLAFGVDFGWSCPLPGGMAFGASYLSHDPAKDWSATCVGAYKRAGRARIAVWETLANRAGQGWNAGWSDAREARAHARSLGWPDSRPIFYAIDFDAQGPEVYPYFQGAISGDHSAGGCGRLCVRSYGGAAPTDYLCARGIVGNWVTYAWLLRTGGQWPSVRCAPLQQYLNSGAVDYDRALAPDYGQWPGPRSVDRYALYPSRRFKLRFGQAASENATVRTWDRAGCQNPVRRPVCKSTRWHLSLLRDRQFYLATHARSGRALAHARWSYPNARQPLGPRFQGVSRRLRAR